MSLLDSLKAKAGAWAVELAGGAAEKLKNTIDEIHNFAPHLRDVGYRLTQLDVEIALSPRVILHLDRDYEATEEQFQALLAQHSGRRLMSLVVKALWQANHLQKQLGLDQQRFRGIELEAGIPPIVRMKYGESESVVVPPVSPEGSPP